MQDFKNKGCSEKLALEIMKDIINGLTALNKEGYVHRDLKPENIIIKNKNEKKIYKITDFGSARIMDNFSDENM